MCFSSSSAEGGDRQDSEGCRRVRSDITFWFSIIYYLFLSIFIEIAVKAKQLDTQYSHYNQIGSNLILLIKIFPNRMNHQVLHLAFDLIHISCWEVFLRDLVPVVTIPPIRLSQQI